MNEIEAWEWEVCSLDWPGGKDCEIIEVRSRTQAQELGSATILGERDETLCSLGRKVIARGMKLCCAY